MYADSYQIKTSFPGILYSLVESDSEDCTCWLESKTNTGVEDRQESDGTRNCPLDIYAKVGQTNTTFYSLFDIHMQQLQCCSVLQFALSRDVTIK